MEQQRLQVELREGTGKGAVRKLRAQGRIPAVVYGRGMQSVHVTLEPRAFDTVVAVAGTNHLIMLDGPDPVGGCSVIVNHIMRDTLKGFPTHVDFHKVNMADKVKVRVPVKPVGDCIGVKHGGLLDLIIHEVELECFPSNIPDAFEVDVTDLRIGHAIHLGEAGCPQGCKVVGDPTAPIISILGRAKEEAPAA